MKIIFSPSKEMAFKNPIDQKVKYSKNTKAIIEELKSLDDQDLKKAFQISDEVLAEVKDYIEGFSKDQGYVAIEMYKGLSYRTLDIESLDREALAYLEDHLKILSAFYGPISPEKIIRPYRLDFTSKIKIQDKSLKTLWKEDFSKAFERKEDILNLASNEFSSLLKREDFSWYDFEFFEEENGRLKSHSTISKKARGLMVRYLAQEKIEDIEKIKNFSLDSYKYNKDLSEDRKFVFVKTIKNARP